MRMAWRVSCSPLYRTRHRVIRQIRRQICRLLLVRAMRPLTLFLVLSAANVVAAGSHCFNYEQVIFSCSIQKSSKIVSLCASRTLAKGQGALAYRFGVPGRLELQYPHSPDGSIQQFRHAHYFRHQIDRTEVSFSVGSFIYSVFDYYDGEEKPKHSRGVRVSNSGEKSRATELVCVGAVQSELQKLAGIVPCDENNPLSSCQ